MVISSPNGEYIQENKEKSAGQDLTPLGSSHQVQNYSSPQRNCFLLNKWGLPPKTIF